MRLGKHWAIFEPLGAPPFVTTFTDPDGEVGIRFFDDWTARNGWTIGPEALTPGLFDRIEQLHCDAFDATAVHGIVRELYERTTTVSFVAERPLWNPLGWVIHTIYNRWIAHRMRQLNAPLVQSWFPTEIKSRITPIRPSSHGEPRHRAWIRTYVNADDHKDGIFYTAAVSHHETTGWAGSQRYLVAVLPLRWASMTVVFQAENLPNGGFAIDTVHPGSYDAGTYLVLPGRHVYGMMPAFVRDQIRLHVRWDESGEYLEGAHKTWGFGILGYTIPYTIRSHAPAAFPPRPAPQFAKDDEPPARTSVVVAGAGPAGLAAATALARAGVEVVLLEAAPALGGKAYTARGRGGRAHGHGVHGWWPSYLNFDAMLRGAGLDPEDVLRPAWQGGLLLEPGRMGHLRNPFVLVPSPFHLLGTLRDLDMARFRDVWRLLRFIVHVLAFDHARDYGRYDGVSLAELARRCGVDETAMKRFLEPFAVSFDYAQPEAVSASSILSAMQFYLLPGPTAMQPRWCRGLEHERIFQPIVTALRAHGGRFRGSTELESVEIVDGRVVAVSVVRPGADDGDTVIADVAVDDIPSNRWLEVSSDAGKLFVGRTLGGFRTFASACPHLHARVVHTGSGFACRLHDSAFDADGKYLRGPEKAKPGMTARRWEQRGDRLVVFGTPTRTRIACDAVIVATSLPPARDILAASPGVPPALVADLRALQTTPVIVVRMWLLPAAPVAADRESIVLPDGRFADVMFHLNAIGQSRAGDGIVLEVHCACSGRKAGWRDAPDAAILEAALADLATIAPGLTAAHVDSERPPEIQRHADSFTLYAPNDAGRRPGAETGVRGLLLAGDWTRTDWSVWMGERAVVSGLRAANVVLASLGKAAQPIARLPREGMLLRLSRLVARVARRFLPAGG